MKSILFSVIIIGLITTRTKAKSTATLYIEVLQQT